MNMVGPLDDTLKNQRYFVKKYVALTIKQLPESGLFEQQSGFWSLSTVYTYKAFFGSFDLCISQKLIGICVSKFLSSEESTNSTT